MLDESDVLGGKGLYNMTMQEIFPSLVSRSSFQITLQVLAI